MLKYENECVNYSVPAVHVICINYYRNISSFIQSNDFKYRDKINSGKGLVEMKQKKIVCITAFELDTIIPLFITTPHRLYYYSIIPSY